MVDHAGRPITVVVDDFEAPSGLEIPGCRCSKDGIDEAWGDLCDQPSERCMLLLINCRCGACAADLRELAPGDGGLTTCASCGAAWDLAGVREEHPQPWWMEWRDEPLRDGTHYQILDANGVLRPCRLKSARPIGKGARSRGIQLFFAFLCLIPFTCLGDRSGMVFVIGTGLILALALAHAVLHALFKELARDQAMESLRSDICPCCEQPLGKELSRLRKLRVCSHCGGAWNASGLVDKVNDLRGL